MKCEKCPAFGAGGNIVNMPAQPCVEERPLFDSKHAVLCTSCLNEWDAHVDDSAEYERYQKAHYELMFMKITHTPSVDRATWVLVCEEYQASRRALNALAVAWLAMPLPDAQPTQFAKLRDRVEQARDSYELSDTSLLAQNRRAAYGYCLQYIDDLATPDTDAAPPDAEPMHRGDVNALFHELAKLRKRVVALEHPKGEPEPDDGNIPEWRTYIGRINDRFDAQRPRVTNLEDRVDKLERRMPGVRSQIASQSQIGGLAERVTKLADAANSDREATLRLEGLSDRVVKLEGKVPRVDECLLKQLMSRADDAQQRVDALSARVAKTEGRAARTDATLDGTISRIEKLEGGEG